VHFVRHKVQSKEIQVLHVPTTDQPADIFTKALSAPRFNYLLHKLPVMSSPVSLRGHIEGKDDIINSS
jgi:histone deacetylase 1/2